MNRVTAASLHDLGALVVAHYPDRPDLALIVALRLLAGAGSARGITVSHSRGLLLTRRALLQVRSPRVPSSVNEARDLSDQLGGGMLLLGTPMPCIVISDGAYALDIAGTYRIGELDLPRRLLHGLATRHDTHHDHSLVDFPYGLTGVYASYHTTSPLNAALRLTSQLGPLMRRRIEHDLRQLEPTWRQLRDTA